MAEKKNTNYTENYKMNCLEKGKSAKTMTLIQEKYQTVRFGSQCRQWSCCTKAKCEWMCRWSTKRMCLNVSLREPKEFLWKWHWWNQENVYKFDTEGTKKMSESDTNGTKRMCLNGILREPREYVWLWHWGNQGNVSEIDTDKNNGMCLTVTLREQINVFVCI